MTLQIPVGPSVIMINRDDRVLVCQPDGRIVDGFEGGLFARDTRFVSGYGLLLNGHRPVLLNSSPVQSFSARFEFTNDALLDAFGPVDPHTLSVRLDRTIEGGVHEDYDVVNYGRRAVRLTIEIEVHSDFADIFDVKDAHLVRRGTIQTQWFRSRRELHTTYVNSTFRRELIVSVARADSPPQFANGRLVFVATIQPKAVWHACVHWLPMTDTRRRPAVLGCNAIAGRVPSGSPRLPRVRLDTPNVTVRRAWERAVLDMEALRLEDPSFERGVFVPAAGVPWFLTIFGRDSLVVSMQGISGFP
jgi:glycogen debranching enzyme